MTEPDRIYESYDTVIGLEVHVELATESKLFCACSAAFGAPPNTHTCPVCTGMPGSLPVLNKRVVDYALAVGLALHCRIRSFCRFDRKNYFYPDNPQNYQISQLYLPFCHDGWMQVSSENEERKIRIHEIHMEEDAGKLIHDNETGMSLVDYNRAGVPLIEIVTEPDFRNAGEVIAWLEQLRILLQYLGVSDGKLNEGSMRVDVNLSVSPQDSHLLGTRTEMKNLNSFRSISRAIEAERRRQIQCLQSGMKVEQETRRWDEQADCSYPMRSKEDAKDYRYFPEPDLPPLHISEEWLQEIRKKQPELREEKRKRYRDSFGLSDYDAALLTEEKYLTELFEASVGAGADPKETANYFMGDGIRLLKEKGWEWKNIFFRPEYMAGMQRLIKEGSISRTVAKQVFEQVFLYNTDPDAYVDEKGLRCITDEKKLEEVIQEILDKNPQSVADYKAGKQRAIGFLVGQTMKILDGKADPQALNRILKQKIEGCVAEPI